MSADSMSSFSEILVSDKSGEGAVIRGIPDETVLESSGVYAVVSGDDIVTSMIRLDRLNQNEVQNILKVLQPYDNNIKVVTKKELSANASLNSLGDPSEMLTEEFIKKTDLDVSAEKTVCSLDSLKAKLDAAQAVGSQLNSSVINDVPNVNLTKASDDIGAEFTLSSLAKMGPDLDGTLTTPNVSLATPHLENHSASLDIDKPEVNTGNLNYKAPNFKMPKFDLPALKRLGVDGGLDPPSVNAETKGLNLSSPQLDIKSTNVDMNGPKVDLNGPDVHFQSPNTDIGLSLDPFKWPHQKWKGPHGPHLKWKKDKLPGAKNDLELDAGFNTPEIDLSIPKVEGGLYAANIDANLANAEFKSPDLEIQQPNFSGPSGKFVWPHQKWKKPKIKGPKADLDIDGRLNTPELDLSTPKLNSGINAQLEFPKADIESANLDVETPNLDIETPSWKKNFHLKFKKPKLPDPKLETNLRTPNIGLSVPSIDGDINAPDVDLNIPEPNLQVNAPDVDIGAPSGKVKFPTLKKPMFRLAGPKMKTPSVDLDTDVKAPDLRLSTSQASLHGPDLNLPKADVDVKAPNADASGKIKWPTLKKPKWSVTGPKVNSPDFDTVSTPDLSLAAPKIDGNLNAPDLKLTTTELNGPKLDIDTDGPSGKFKWLMKFGTLKGLKSDIDGDIKVPDVDLGAPDIDLREPDVSVSPKIEAPVLNFSMPKANSSDPNVNLYTPNPNIETNDGKLKLPKIKIPKWPKVKGTETNLKAPNIDANVDVPNIHIEKSKVDLKAPYPSLSSSKFEGSIDSPDIELQSPVLSTGKLQFPNLNLPKLSGQKIEKPNLDFDADVKGPHLDLAPLDINPPDMTLSSPKIDGGLAAPDLSLGKADLNGPHFDLADPHNADIGLPHLNLSAPQITSSDADVNLPKANLKGPSLHLPSPSNLNIKKTDLSLGNPHALNVGTKLSSADLEASDVRFNNHLPDVKINMPTADIKGTDGQLKTPELGLDSQRGEFMLPHYKLPKLDLSSPGVEVPSVHSSVQAGLEAPKGNIDTSTADANISVPTVDLSGSLFKGETKGPEVDVEPPKVDTGLQKAKLPHFKVPKLSFSGSKNKPPEVNTSPKLSLDGKISPLTVSGPEMRSNTPELTNTAGDAGIKGSPKSKLKWPFKWGFKSSSVDTEEHGDNAEVDAPKFRLHTLPRNCAESNGETPDIFSLSKSDNENKEYVVSKGIRLPVVNVPSRNGGSIDIMERLKMAKEKAPLTNTSPTEERSIGLNMAHESLDASGEAGDSSFVRGETFKVEKPTRGLIAPDIYTADESDKLSLSLSNMLGLDVNNSDADC